MALKECIFYFFLKSIEDEEKMSKILEKKENSNKVEVMKPNLSPNRSQLSSNDHSNNSKHVDSSTYSRKTGSVIGNDLKNGNNNIILSNQQNVSKIHMKNSLYFSSSDSVSYTGKICLIRLYKLPKGSFFRVLNRLRNIERGFYLRKYLFKKVQKTHFSGFVVS